MGESKRRKKLDPGYGKIPRGQISSNKLNKKLFEILVSGIAILNYSKQGKGCVILRNPNDLLDQKQDLSKMFIYVSKENLYSSLEQLEKRDSSNELVTDFFESLNNYIDRYNPEKELVFANLSSLEIETIDLAKEEVEIIAQDKLANQQY